MKYGRTILISLFATFVAGIAPAQQNLQGAIQHVIVVIQENRTPDNLFREDTLLVNHGADVVPPSPTLMTACDGGPVTQTGAALASCFDPDHSHASIPNYSDGAWEKTYDGGLMDGACHVYINHTICTTTPPCVSNHSCAYSYVNNTLINQYGVLQPYFDMGQYYGFANYTFQTNQGPSFEAHQFLFAGTSAPDDPSDTNDASCNNTGGDDAPCYKWFASELQHTNTDDYGCPDTGGDVAEVDPDGDDLEFVYGSGYPCYLHSSIADLLDNNTVNGHAITWAYYPQGASPNTSLWSAPNAINNICMPLDQSTGYCNGTLWNSNVKTKIPPDPAQTNSMAPILTDIGNCNLPNVSFVIPDGSWSDHAGNSDGSTPPGNYGPSWVSAIVNGVGGATTCDSHGYWNDTVIIVTWDDWGGWYDHVLPWNCKPASQGGGCSGYSNGQPGEGKQYVYGFRVPMLVISAYNKHATNNGDGYVGYISGSCGTGLPSCPNEGVGLVHDFGSILNFIEYAFGTNGNFLTYNNSCGIGPCSWPYADYLAPDVFTGNPNCSPSTCPYSLSDFFTGTWSTQSQFVQIMSYAYPPSTFENWSYEDGNYRTDPDTDALPPQ